MSWPEVTFETLYSAPSRNGVYKAKEAHGSGTKIVNMGELFAHEFIGSQEMSRLSMSEAEMETSGLQEGDLLFGRRSLVEAGAGKCSIVRNLVEPATLESSIIRTRLNKDLCDPLFYYYWFKSPLGRGRIRALVSGTNVKGIRGSDLKRLSVVFPPKPLQERIVGCVMPYDVLIDNNRKRIALLEQAVRMLYREWLVRFRFPGHEHVEIINGIPEGWRTCRLDECVSFQSGGTPSKARAEYWLGNVPWISSGELTTMRVSTSQLSVTEEAVAEGSRYAEKDTILAVVRGMSLAKQFRVGIVARRVCFNQDIKALVPDRGIEGLFLFHALYDQRDNIRQRASEASHGTKKLETAVLESLLIIVPPPAVRRHFIEYAEPMHAQWDVLNQQNRHLKTARDLLLPRLMNGEIAV
jgi:type I restriction enzyme S subunit